MTGDVGRHGCTILLAREDFGIEADVTSDCAPLWHTVEEVINATHDLHVIRDATRGGVGTVLYEIAGQSNVGIRLDAEKVPVAPEVNHYSYIFIYIPRKTGHNGTNSRGRKDCRSTAQMSVFTECGNYRRSNCRAAGESSHDYRNRNAGTPSTAGRRIAATYLLNNLKCGIGDISKTKGDFSWTPE